jgi:hypothetical protein
MKPYESKKEHGKKEHMEKKSSSKKEGEHSMKRPKESHKRKKG